MKNGHEMFHHAGSSLRFPTKEYAPCPRCHHASIGAHLATVRSLATRAPHRPSARMPPLALPREGLLFEKLVQVLLFGCAYERIADGTCSESTLRREGATSRSSLG